METRLDRKTKYLFHVVHAHLGVVLLGLELELDVEQGDAGVLVGLLLHLEPGVGEGLLERDAGDEEGLLEGAALHLLHADHVEGHQLVQHGDGVNHDLQQGMFVSRNWRQAARLNMCPIYLSEEVLLLVDEL